MKRTTKNAPRPHRVRATPALPLDYGPVPTLPGVEDPDGASPPKDVGEATAVGTQAAQDGAALRDLFLDAMRRWPGSIHLETAVKAWFAGRKEAAS
jgi:hypothetical protein